MAESVLDQPHFRNADSAREYLEHLRWPSGPICPHCGSIGKHYSLKGKAHRVGVWKCRDCRAQFTVTVKTVFERSKIPLHIWLKAVYLLCSSKKGISSHQLHRTLNVDYKTAWFMSHRIREAMTSNPSGLLGGGGGTVEADETFWGNNKRRKGPGRGYDHKMKVFALVERKGHVRSFHVADVRAKTLAAIIREHVSTEAHLRTDEASMYVTVGKEFASHESVAHGAREYARGDVNTNSIESYFAMLKRGLIGTYHKCGEGHLHRYANEFSFRYNNRAKLGINDLERTDNALRGIGGKRLTYRMPHYAQEVARNP
jgi:transposase-like protein